MTNLFAIRQSRRQKLLRHLHNVLTLESTEAWVGTPRCLSAWLSEEELALLGYCCLRALPADVAVEVASGALTASETPVPELRDDQAGLLVEARLWASQASGSMIRAVAMSCVDQMPPRTLGRFRDWLSKRGRK